MIRGAVIEDAEGRLEPWVEISVADSRGNLHAIQVVVDTGFTGWLALSTDFSERLGLRRVGRRPASLADGSENEYRYYEGNILWHDRLRSISIIALDADPLIGTQLLTGCRLTVEFRDGGDVEIQEPTPSPH